MSRHWLLALAIGVILLLLPRLLSDYFLGVATEGLIMALFAVSLGLLAGQAGLPSLGHAAFFGTGAYAVAFLSLRVSSSFWLTFPLALAAAAAVGALFGLFALRTRGGYFLMTTLALAQVLWGIVYGWVAVTGGDDGLANIPGPAFGGGAVLTRIGSVYDFTLGMVAAAGLLVLLVVNSPVGYALRGIRESESRMRALGYNVWAYKYLAFVLSAGFAGLAGALWTYYEHYVSPELLHVALSAKGLLMVAIGGSDAALAPAFGAVIVVLLQRILSTYTDRWMFCLGVVYVLVTLVAPQGIFALPARLFRRRVPR